MYYVIYDKETLTVRNLIHGDITKSTVLETEEYAELESAPTLTERIQFYKFIDGAFVLDSAVKTDHELVKYKKYRALAYPPITDFADAWVKQDEVALEEYRQKCLEVKAKYPKPL